MKMTSTDVGTYEGKYFKQDFPHMWCVKVKRTYGKNNIHGARAWGRVAMIFAYY